MYVCMYVCTYVCTYVRMYVYIQVLYGWKGRDQQYFCALVSQFWTLLDAYCICITNEIIASISNDVIAKLLLLLVMM